MKQNNDFLTIGVYNEFTGEKIKTIEDISNGSRLEIINDTYVATFNGNNNRSISIYDLRDGFRINQINMSDDVQRIIDLKNGLMAITITNEIIFYCNYSNGCKNLLFLNLFL